MRFLPIGAGFHWGNIHIYPGGVDIEDPRLIKKLLKSPHNQVAYYSPEEAPPKPKKPKAEPKRKKQEEYPTVAPLTMPDVEVELRLAAEEEAMKKTEAEIEAEKKVALQMAKEQEAKEGKERAELRKSARVRSKK